MAIEGRDVSRPVAGGNRDSGSLPRVPGAALAAFLGLWLTIPGRVEGGLSHRRIASVGRPPDIQAELPAAPARPTSAPIDPEEPLDPSLEAYWEAGIEALDKGRLLAAEQFLESAMARARDLSLPDPSIAALLLDLAHLYEDTGRVDDADGSYHRAVDAWRASTPPAPAELASALVEVGTFCERVDRLEEAVDHLQEALALQEEDGGPDSVELAGTLDALGSAQRRLGDPEGARTHFERALALRRRHFGESDASIGASLVQLAGLAVDERRFEEARALFERALSIQIEALGPEAPDVGRTQEGLAALHEAAEEPEIAADTQEAAVQVLAKGLPEDHPSLVGSLAYLGALRLAAGRIAEAADSYRDVLLRRERSLGDENLEVAWARHDLATVLARTDATDAVDEALGLARQAHARIEAALGREDDDTIYVLGTVGVLLQQKGEFAEAEAVLREALARDESDGDVDPDLLRDLADLLRERGKPEESRTLEDRATRIEGESR